MHVESLTKVDFEQVLRDAERATAALSEAMAKHPEEVLRHVSQQLILRQHHPLVHVTEAEKNQDRLRCAYDTLLCAIRRLETARVSLAEAKKHADLSL